jgi:hypothetical protein
MSEQRRFDSNGSLRERKARLSKQAARWREQANALPPGPAREVLLSKAKQTGVASDLDEWLASPGRQPPK